MFDVWKDAQYELYYPCLLFCTEYKHIYSLKKLYMCLGFTLECYFHLIEFKYIWWSYLQCTSCNLLGCKARRSSIWLG